MSPERATLLHSPGRKPWVNYWNIFMSPKGAALPRRKANARIIVPLLRSSIRFYLRVPRVAFRALPSFHPGLCRSVVPTALAVAEYTHSPKCLRVLTEISTRTYRSVYVYLRKRVRRTHCSEYVVLIVVRK